MTGEQLKTIIERSGLRTNEMASRLGMLPQQLNNVFHTNDVKTGIVGTCKPCVKTQQGTRARRP